MPKGLPDETGQVNLLTFVSATGLKPILRLV
jgi:hypothetical protein